nr:HRDC domain-containing protein [Betaproteobacteria bacterium]
LIDVLRGKQGERVTKWEHDKLSVFGVGADVDEGSWRGVFRQLIAMGLARVDHESHGALKLAEPSRAVLKGEQLVEMRRVVAGHSRSKRSRKQTGFDLAPGAAGLFERLKRWRLAEAQAQAVPAYVILHDSTLAELARRRPRSLDELAGITGIGARKLERYGASLLDVVNTSTPPSS